MLPEELGGKLFALSSLVSLSQTWKAKIAAHPEVFDEYEKYKIELTNEISKTRTTETAECLVGTYRKLNID